MQGVSWVDQYNYQDNKSSGNILECSGQLQANYIKQLMYQVLVENYLKIGNDNNTFIIQIQSLLLINQFINKATFLYLTPSFFLILLRFLNFVFLFLHQMYSAPLLFTWLYFYSSANSSFSSFFSLDKMVSRFLFFYPGQQFCTILSQWLPLLGIPSNMHDRFVSHAIYAQFMVDGSGHRFQLNAGLLYSIGINIIILMSSISMPQRTRLTPLNITSETVHQLLKQAPKGVPSLKKIYPTAKYVTEEIRSGNEGNKNMAKHIKQFEKVKSDSKQSKSRGYAYKTETTDYFHESKNNDTYFKYVSKQKRLSNKQKSLKKYEEDIVLFKNDSVGKKYDLLEKTSAQKYLQKVNRIKSLKLKLFLKNKFAIDIKTIETERKNEQDMLDMKDKKIDNVGNIKAREQSKSLFKHNSYEAQRDKYKVNSSVQLKSNQEKQNHLWKDDGKRNSGRAEKTITQQTSKDSSFQIKLKSAIQKLEHFKLQKTQNLDSKNFSFTRQFQDHPAESRFERMIEHFTLILLSFGCQAHPLPKPLPPYNRNSVKYKYYVGPGNNKNLIISIMKKRWWWQEVGLMSEAQFIWTQLKQEKVMRQCQKHIEENYQQTSKAIQKVLNSTQYPKKITPKNCKIQRLFHDKSQIKQQLHFKNDQMANKGLKVIEAPNKLHNHYEGNSMIGNKKALFYFISLFCDYKKLNRYDYIPLTFHIKDEKCDEIKNFEQAFKLEQNSFWVIKPGENSNRGNGISVSQSLSEIKQKMKNLGGGTLIIQKYIQNLFLYNGRKFDIRTYMIAATIGGSTKFYWYSEGYLRTSSFFFNLKKHSDIYIHLTNDAIQSKNENYSKYEEGNKLSYHQFQRYLDGSFKNKKYSIKSAHDQMKKIAKLAVCSTYPLINSSKLDSSFEVFGLDFILDSNFTPWLIQINTNPCLQLCAPCLERLIPQMLENCFRLALDPIFQPCVDFPRSMSSSIPDNILSSNRFSLIFDQFYDRDAEWEKIVKQKPLALERVQEDEEQFDGDGILLQNL